MAGHLTLAELQAGLPALLDAPADNGVLDAIVVRPRSGAREDVASVDITRAGGVAGDTWSKRCWIKTEDGHPHPDVQICIMASRTINLIAGGERANWLPAGDNLFVDLDLSQDNLKPGQRLAIGSAVVEITSEPHLGCAKFSKRYGRDAVVFVNKGDGARLRLRGIYARVVKDGRVSVGDRVRKLADCDMQTENAAGNERRE